MMVKPKAMLVDRALEIAPSDAVLVPTGDGATARAVARCWTVTSESEGQSIARILTSQGLALDIP
jgi:hypothetical protein